MTWQTWEVHPWVQFPPMMVCPSAFGVRQVYVEVVVSQKSPGVGQSESLAHAPHVVGAEVEHVADVQ
jgi:hypothetical protein